MRLIFLLALKITLLSCSNWDYQKNGPSSWFLNYPACGTGQITEKQSPINIITSNLEFDSSLKPFKMNYYDSNITWKLSKTADTGIFNILKHDYLINYI